MSKTITKLDNDTYETRVRGNHMTLRRARDGWEMWTTNASTRAWSGMPSIRHFESLTSVETGYKSWAGIATLASAESLLTS